MEVLKLSILYCVNYPPLTIYSENPYISACYSQVEDLLIKEKFH